MTGACLVCGKVTKLRQNGTVRKHTRTMGDGHRLTYVVERCPGSHLVPLPRGRN